MESHKKVIVYILGSKPENKLENLFDQSYFSVIRSKTETNDYWENLSQCLGDAKRNHPDSFVIVIQRNSICSGNKKTVREAVSTAISRLQFDIFYLCKWMDKCQLYTDIYNWENYFTAKTQAPNGTQAILLSPRGVDVILGKKPMENGQTFNGKGNTGELLRENITSGNISASCLVPNLFDFDIRTSLSNSDYSRLTQCQDIPPSTTQSSSSNTSFGAFLIVLFLFIILVAFIIAQARGRG